MTALDLGKTGNDFLPVLGSEAQWTLGTTEKWIKNTTCHLLYKAFARLLSCAYESPAFSPSEKSEGLKGHITPRLGCLARSPRFCTITAGVGAPGPTHTPETASMPPSVQCGATSRRSLPAKCLMPQNYLRFSPDYSCPQ